ncbi:MAG: hypothetical protein WBI40_09425 [Methylococcaceae bacterium]
MNEDIIFALTQSEFLPGDDSEQSKNYLAVIADFLEQGIDVEELDLVQNIQIEYGDVSSNHILNFSDLDLYLLMISIDQNWIAIEAKLVFDDADFSEISQQENYRLLFQYPYQLDVVHDEKSARSYEFVSVFIGK